MLGKRQLTRSWQLVPASDEARAPISSEKWLKLRDLLIATGASLGCGRSDARAVRSCAPRWPAQHQCGKHRRGQPAAHIYAVLSANSDTVLEERTAT